LVTQYPRKRPIACKMCGNTFLARGPGKWSYCSDICRRRNSTNQHARYVSRNRSHVRAYSLERKRRVWGTSNRSIAAAAERIAASKVLPQLGFSEIYHLSTLNSFFPFDIVATLQDERVLVDVTTGAGKSLRRQRGIANALRMKSFVLFIKPDLESYYLTEVDSDHVAYHKDGLKRIA
jgi:hypothetical protein